ncbi:hypothetical protein [Methanococcoides sp. LMO-2]|uniref:Uncharacterized protein n=1 Tax=Methanococcoides cohabitans TaxID=3136559 RepID=A0ABU9KVA2_9EURY
MHFKTYNCFGIGDDISKKEDELLRQKKMRKNNSKRCIPDKPLRLMKNKARAERTTIIEK